MMRISESDWKWKHQFCSLQLCKVPNFNTSVAMTKCFVENYVKAKAKTYVTNGGGKMNITYIIYLSQ